MQLRQTVAVLPFTVTYIKILLDLPINLLTLYQNYSMKRLLLLFAIALALCGHVAKAQQPFVQGSDSLHSYNLNIHNTKRNTFRKLRNTKHMRVLLANGTTVQGYATALDDTTVMLKRLFADSAAYFHPNQVVGMSFAKVPLNTFKSITGTLGYGLTTALVGFGTAAIVLSPETTVHPAFVFYGLLLIGTGVVIGWGTSVIMFIKTPPVKPNYRRIVISKTPPATSW